MFGLFRRKSEIKALIEKRSEELRQEDAIFYEYSTMFAASSVELLNKKSNIYFIFRHEKVLRSLKYLEHIIPSLRDPLIFYFWMPLNDLFDDIAHQMSAYRLLQPSESCRAPQP
jgi:hypothetical protein